MQAAATPVDEWRVECFLIHHGPGEWRSPTRLDALFPHWSPGEYRVISAGRRSRGSARLDLVEAILLLERDRSAAGTTRALKAIRAVAEASGSGTSSGPKPWRHWNPSSTGPTTKRAWP